MASTRQRIKVMSPFKGLLSGYSQQIDPHYLVTCNNVMFDKLGNITKRQGITLSDKLPPVMSNNSAVSDAQTERCGFGLDDLDPVEMVTNGGFDTASDWNIHSDGSVLWAVSGGSISITNPDDLSYYEQDLGLVTGETYEISYKIVTNTASLVLSLYGGFTSRMLPSEAGVHTLRLACVDDAVTYDLQFFTDTDTGILTIDNISVKHVASTGNTGWLSYSSPDVFEATSAGTPDTGSYHFHVKHTGTGWRGFTLQNLVFEAGTEYTLTFSHKLISGTNWELIIYDGDGTTQIYNTQYNEYAYTETIYQFTPSVGGVSGKLLFTNKNSANEFYVDNVSLSPNPVINSKIDGMFRYISLGTVGNPTTTKIYHANGNLYAVPNGSYLSLAKPIKTGLTENKTVDHAILRDKYFSANGEDLLQCYNGSAMVTVTPPGSGITGTFTPSIVEVHSFSVWAADVKGNPSRLYKSVPLDGTDFDTNLTGTLSSDGYPLSGASYIDVRADDGTGITGLVGDHFGQLIIFKENSIHRLLGATKADYALPPFGVINGIGAIRGSIVRANNDIFFLSKKGAHRLATVQEYGDNKESYISLPIQEYFDGLDKFVMTNNCQSAHWAEVSCIFWSLPIAGVSQNNVLLVYNYAINAWSVWPNLSVRCFGLFKSDGRNTMFVGDYTGQVGMMDIGQQNDFSEAYIMEAEIKLDFGDPARSKGWRRALFFYNQTGGTISEKHRVDNDRFGSTQSITSTQGHPLDSFLLDTDYLSDSGDTEMKSVELNKSGRTLSINLQNRTVDEAIGISGVVVEAVPQGYY